jgi:hypothetical protein
MKKNGFIIWVIISSLFIFVCLTGCNEPSDGSLSKFIGTWEYLEVEPPIYEEKWTFYTNGTILIDAIGIDHFGEEYHIIDFTRYWLEDQKINIKVSISNVSYEYNYEFSEDDTLLILSNNEIPYVFSFKKIQ